jgi:hypothetical protein
VEGIKDDNVGKWLGTIDWVGVDEQATKNGVENSIFIF